MDKRVQKKLKRNELDKIMAKYPTLEAFLEAQTDGEVTPELEEIIEASVADMMQDQFMRGVNTGYVGAMVGAYKKIESCEDVKSAIDILKAEANEFCQKIGLKSVEEFEKFDDEVE